MDNLLYKSVPTVAVRHHEALPSNASDPRGKFVYPFLKLTIIVYRLNRFSVTLNILCVNIRYFAKQYDVISHVDLTSAFR